MSNKRKTFWPYGIILSIIAIIISCAYTIYYSLDYPVHLDDFYFDKYQKVERNFNDIQIMQSNFDKEFFVNIKNPEVFIDGNKVDYEFFKPNRKRPMPVFKPNANLTIKFDTNASNLELTTRLTRPHNNFENKELNASIVANKIEIPNLKITDEGRWQILLKAKADENKVGFFKFDFYVK